MPKNKLNSSSKQFPPNCFNKFLIVSNIILIISITFGVIIHSGGWHIAEEILSGNFRGNYTFENNVNINGKLYTNNIFENTQIEQYDLSSHSKITGGFLKFKKYDDIICFKIHFMGTEGTTINNDEVILVIDKNQSILPVGLDYINLNINLISYNDGSSVEYSKMLTLQEISNDEYVLNFETNNNTFNDNAGFLGNGCFSYFK